MMKASGGNAPRKFIPVDKIESKIAELGNDKEAILELIMRA